MSEETPRRPVYDRAARWYAHSAWVQKGSGPPRGRTLFARRSVRGIFRHVRAATKNDSASFRRHRRRKPGRGSGPFLDFSQDGRATLRRAPRNGGRGSPVGCLLLLEVPAVRLAAERHCRRKGRCGGGTGDEGTGADASLRAGDEGTGADASLRAGDEGRGTGDEGRETGDEGRETRDGRRETRDGRRGTGDEGRETRDGRRGTGDEGRETRDGGA